MITSVPIYRRNVWYTNDSLLIRFIQRINNTEFNALNMYWFGKQGQNKFKIDELILSSMFFLNSILNKYSDVGICDNSYYDILILCAQFDLTPFYCPH